MSDHLIGTAKRAVDAASLDVGQALGQLRVSDAPLLRRVLVVSRRKLGKDGDYAARNLEFKFLAALKPGTTAHSGRNYERCLVF